ncbi:MAG: SDR family oxidoreductase [Flavobacteriaceae bacterium]|jgi:NAD(P)-dependent dehydrogenase (short-subunit alcohol dehydrogenase family)|nr:SDR family oxidoreductase [Flavobacteriaceae bacterium]MDO7582532.1 SDR family oxidoreductase [Flavobacteriaceae bacterium]MDO7591529.1 SDR family oxidoreductase [Flavobacteriaceae bacterium]MDO7598522.1 SDR family oxidoreductase [Flavobacteriaceae bacterium]MDO7602767.1 SDR family oxidoreductase [Flavobacteriaceae bacterium]
MIDKKAFITGAAKGLGRATAVALSASGYKTILTDIDPVTLAETKKIIEDSGGSASTYLLDVSDKKQIESVLMQAIKDEKKIDAFINNAGIGGVMAPFHEMKDEDWDNLIAVNLSSVFYCLKFQLKILLDQGGGNIVNVASLAGKKGVPLGCHYSASKHGVIGLTKTAAVEYGSRNIRVNAICPSFIETDIIEAVPKPILEFVANFRVPLKRLGRPEEVANAIKFMLSDDSSYMNGHSLVLDGGMDAG